MPRRIEQEYWIRDKASGQMRKATSNVKTQLKNVEKTSKTATAGMAKNWKSLIGVIGAAGVGAALASLGKQTLAYGDQLQKLNLRVGISVDSLDKIRKAGELAGVEFNTITKSISVMARNLDMARKGTGEAADALNELGLSVEDLDKMDTEEQFLAIGEAISKMTDPTKKQAAAMKLLGRGGVELLSLFPTLRDSMAALNSEWSQERADRVAAFNDSITELKFSFQDLAVVAMDKLLPVMEFVVNNFDKIVVATSVMIAVKLAAWFLGIATAMVAFSVAWRGVGLLKFIKSLGILMLSAKSVTAAFKILITTLKNTVPWFRATLVFFSNPAVLTAAAAITALTYAYLLLKYEIIAFFSVIKDGIKENETIITEYKNLKESLSGIWTTIKSKVIPIWEKFKYVVLVVLKDLRIQFMIFIKGGIIVLVKAFEFMVKGINIALKAWSWLRFGMLKVQKTMTDVAAAILDNFVSILTGLDNIIKEVNYLVPGDRWDIAPIPIDPEFIKSLTNTSDKLKGLSNDIDLSADKFKELGLEGSKSLVELSILAKELETLVSNINIEDLIKAAEVLRDFRRRMAEAIPDSYLDFGHWTDSLYDADDAAEKLKSTLKEIKDIWGGGEGYEIDIGPVDEIQKAIDKLLNTRNNERFNNLLPTGTGRPPLEDDQDSAAYDAWLLRIEKQAQTVKEIIADVGLTGKNIASSVADNFTNAFIVMAEGGERFADVVHTMFTSILKEMSMMIIRALIFKAIMGMAGAGGGGSSISSAIAGTGPGIGGSAKGNVFGGGNVIPFRKGGVVSHPTVFPMKKGMGLMGEAGPEAVVPLQRTANGDLGIASTGGGGGTNNLNIYAMDSQSFTEFARRNPGAFTAVMTDMSNKGNSSFKSAVKKAAR